MIVATTLLSRRLGSERATAGSLVVGALAGCALLSLVDPNEGGRYPVCPTRALFGVDCPACGTLRGLHALSRGHVGTAIDHNLLLVVAVPLGAVVWFRWLAIALGRRPRAMRLPAWVAPSAIAVAVAFTLVRNLAPAPWSWLDSA